MTTKEVKVKLKKKADPKNSDAFREILISSIKIFCEETETELDKEEMQAVIKDLQEICETRVLSLVDGFVDCYMMSVVSEEEEEEAGE